jgi:hypothetical protein
MAFVKQFLTKTRPSDNTSMFRYAPALPSGKVEIYTLISISNDVDAETSRFNKFVWDGFLDGFLSKDDEIISRLKNGILGAEFKLKELIRHDNLLEEKGVDLNLSVLIFKENKVFVGILGNHKVLVYRKKVVDISDLLDRSKSTVGSTMVSPEDIFVVSYSEKSIKKGLECVKKASDVEDFLNDTFNEEAKGGAFLATLEEKVAPVVVDQTQVLPQEEENVDEIENEAKQPEQEDLETETEEEPKEEKKAKLKATILLLWGKLKLGFNKVVNFLSEKLSRVFDKLGSSLRNKYGRRRWFKKLQSATSVKKFATGVKPFKVDGYKEKELRSRRFVAFFIVLVLIVALFLGVRSTFEARQRAVLAGELDVLMEEWEDSVQEAERKASDDAEESLGLLSKVSDDLEKYLENLEEKGRFKRLGDENLEKIENLQQELLNIEDKVFRIVPITEKEGKIELFLDTKLSFGEKSNPTDFVISRESSLATGELLYVLDAGEKEVYEVRLSDGDITKVSDPNNLIKEPLFIDLGNNKDDEALYVYDAQSGALRAGRDSEGNFNEFKSLSGLSPRALGGDGVTGFAVFGPTDTLNFLVATESRIVRAQGFGGTTYNLPSEYISHPSFENGTDLFGDQYVYVLSTISNGIRRFVPMTGLNSQLSVTGLTKNLQSITTGYTGTTMDRAFVVFDSETERFVRFSKPIEIGETLVHPGEIVLRHQYEYRGERGDVFKNVKSLVLTHDDKKMYVLDDRKIWQINID